MVLDAVRYCGRRGARVAGPPDGPPAGGSVLPGSSFAIAKCDPTKARRSQRLLLGKDFSLEGDLVPRQMRMQKKGAASAPFSSVASQLQAGVLQILPREIAGEQFAAQIYGTIGLEPEDPRRLSFLAEATKARKRGWLGLGKIEPADPARGCQEMAGRRSKNIMP